MSGAFVHKLNMWIMSEGSDGPRQLKFNSVPILSIWHTVMAKNISTLIKHDQRRL